MLSGKNTTNTTTTTTNPTTTTTTTNPTTFFFSRAREGCAAVHQLTWLTDSTGENFWKAARARPLMKLCAKLMRQHQEDMSRRAETSTQNEHMHGQQSMGLSKSFIQNSFKNRPRPRAMTGTLGRSPEDSTATHPLLASGVVSSQVSGGSSTSVIRSRSRSSRCASSANAGAASWDSNCVQASEGA